MTYVDATESCSVTRALIEAIEKLLRENGVPDGGGSIGDSSTEFLKRKQYFSALRCFVRELRRDMVQALPPDKFPGQFPWILRVCSDGRVVNERKVLWRCFPFLAGALGPIQGTELFATLFQDMFEQEPCDFEVAVKSMPTLVLSCNRSAIQQAMDIIKTVEPLSSELILGQARIRQLELNERAVPVDCLSGRQFEELLARQFGALGLTVNSVGGSGDYGADLLLTARDGTVIAVQAKRWKSRVNLKAVQEVHGSLSFYKADLGIVVSSAGFYPSASQLAERSGVELWGKSELFRFLDGDVSFSQIGVLVNE